MQLRMTRLWMGTFHVVSARCRSKQAKKDTLPMKVDQKVLEHCRQKSIPILFFSRMKGYTDDVCLCHRAAQYTSSRLNVRRQLNYAY